MSQVLYRKWRPRRLDQVVGQEQVTQTLRQAVVLGRVAHAYLFCGPRGTGKTSTARILAKAVNCLSPQDGEPDNECAMCRAINEGRALDLIEIDAASNRGIEEIREINDKSRFTPNEARYKVYIVDEVHMLTEYAFNALLKTLEEPPPHVIFVLATTEVHKVPLTIVSRCQRFDFRRIPPDRMVAKLAELCQSEGVEISEEGLRIITRASGGSLRDAENLLEQVIVTFGSPVSEEQVRELLEMGSDETALELVGHILRRSVKDGLAVISQMAWQGSDLRQLHRGVMEYLRAVMLLKAGTGTALSFTQETVARLQSLADSTTLEHLVHALKTFSRVDLRRDTSSTLPLELALVESSMGPEAPAAPARQPTPEARPAPRSAPPPREHHGNPQASAPQPAPARSADPPAARARPVAQQSATPAASSGPPDMPRAVPPEELPSEPAARLEAQWGVILRALRNKGRRFKLDALLRGCKEREVADGVVRLKFSHRSHVERMQQELEHPDTRKALKDAVASAMGNPYEVEIVLAGDNAGPRQGVSQGSHLVRNAQMMGARVVRVVEEKKEEEEP